MDDFVFPGTLRLEWPRYYSTDIDGPGPLGRSWTVPWFMSLRRVASGYELIDETGRPLIFPTAGGVELEVGSRVASYGANMELIRLDGHFVVDHWHHGAEDIERFCFPSNGKVVMPLGWLENLYGHRIKVECDGSRPVRIVQELEQRVLEVKYDGEDRIDSVVQVLSDGSRKVLVRYVYDEHWNLTAAFDAMDHQTSYQYDGSRRMIRETNALGSSFSFEYDPEGRCVRSLGDGGYYERRLRYSRAERLTKVTDTQGNATSYYLNTAGQVVQEISPLGATTTTEYDELGRPTAITNPLGGVVRYEYDQMGNRSAVVHEDGSRSQMQYNGVHQLLSYTSPSGGVWTYDYNDRGEPIGLTNPLGERHSAVRDERGLVIETRTPSGRVVTRRYGPALRWVEAADGVSLITRTEYDESGNQTAVYDPNGLVQRIVYDSLGRPMAAENDAGRSYRFSWNSLGEMVEQSGPDVAWERRVYDGFGQLIAHINPLGTLRINYDQEGRVVRVINRANEELTWSYSADGWLISETSFDGCTEHFEYDPCGRAVGRRRADGQSLSQVFGHCGELLKQVFSDGEIAEFAYDTDGRLLRAKNRAAEVVLERNRIGRVVAEVQNGRRVEYAYDADGDRAGRHIVGVETPRLTFKRDGRSRLMSISDEAGVCLELDWDTVDRPVERRFAGNTRERFAYDTRGRLSEQAVSSSGLGGLLARRYEYDAHDNLVARFEQKYGSSTFRYDIVGRLIGAEHPGGRSEYYSYDANGTVLDSHCGQRLVASGGRTIDDGAHRYSYGADGAIEQISGQGAVTLLEHNFGGQLARVTLPDGNVVRYEYDALGRRVAKDLMGSRTEFIWEGPVLAAELRNGEPVVGHYVFGFEPLVQWQGTRRLLPIKDQAGVVREVVDDRGAIVYEGRFEAYGGIVDQSGELRSPFRLRGQYVDDETSLHYNFHRTYSPSLCDYTSPDPIGLEGGSHFYSYPRNPLQWHDPFGLKCGTSACGEKSMDGFFGQKGYKKIGSIGKNPNANGIDAIYYKKGGKPPYIIAEAKNGGGYLHTDQHGNQQMSDAWINGAPGNSSTTRLDGAFPPGSPHADRIRAAAEKGNVGTAVYNPERDPKVTHQGQYGGENSTNQSAPPRTP